MTPIRTEALIREARIHPRGKKKPTSCLALKKKRRKKKQKQNCVRLLSVITVRRRADEMLRRDESRSEKCQRRAQRDNGRGGQTESRAAAIYLLLFPPHTPLKSFLFKEAHQCSKCSAHETQLTPPTLVASHSALCVKPEGALSS